jgi:hypothetical protein
MVTGLSFDEPWGIEEVRDIAQAQVDKIKAAKGFILDQ